MKTIKGPAIFLAQFLGDDKPFNNLHSISKWAKKLGYKAIQIPTWDNSPVFLPILRCYVGC
jgi:sugar phosphate isomerase/epimerase